MSASATAVEQLCFGGDGDWWCPTCQVREFLYPNWGLHCPVCVTPLLEYASLSPRVTSTRGVSVVAVPADRPRRVTAEHRAALLALAPAKRQVALTSGQVLTDDGYVFVIPSGDEDWWVR